VGSERAFKIKTPAGWKVIAKVMRIKGEWSFYREMYEPDHKFNTYNAWGLQSILLPVLKQDGVKWLYQYEKKTKTMYRISLKDFEEKSIEQDYGEGNQLFCSTKYFKKINMKRINKWINSIELVA